MLQISGKLVLTFTNKKVPRAEKIANDIKKDLMTFRENLPVIRALCNPGLKQRHWDEMKKLL